MLRELAVQNLAVIEDVRVELQPGFCAWTGETGAGKSLLLGALGLLLGERGSAELIPGRILALRPGVVGELMEKFEGRSIRTESIHAHTEVEGFPADFPSETGVADRSPEPIVVSIMQVAGLGMGVADAPSGHEFFPLVRRYVPPSVQSALLAVMRGRRAMPLRAHR